MLEKPLQFEVRSPIDNNIAPLFGNGINGQTIAISDDGSVIAVGGPSQNSTAVGVFSNETTDVSSSLIGAVWIFKFNGTSWPLTAFIKPGLPVSDAEKFGSSVALSGAGDFLLVTSRQETFGVSPSNGAVSAYSNNGSGWQFLFKIQSPTPMGSSCFGADVTVSRDGKTFAVASEFLPETYVYRVSPTNMSDVTPTTLPVNSTTRVSISDDGSVLAFSRIDTDVCVITAMQRINDTAWGPSTFGSFTFKNSSLGIGLTISPDGGQIYAGRYDPGTMYSFSVSSGRNATDAFFPSPSGISGEEFGNQVSCSTNILIAGAPFKSGGVLYVFNVSTPTFLGTITVNDLLELPVLVLGQGSNVVFSDSNATISVKGSVAIKPGSTLTFPATQNGTFTVISGVSVDGMFSSVNVVEVVPSCQGSVGYSPFSVTITVANCGQQGSGLSAGAVAGIAVGAVLGGILLALLLVFLTRFFIRRDTATQNKRLRQEELARI